MAEPTAASSEHLLQRLEWTVLRRLDGLLQGDWRTLWRGGGIDLADLREYQHHDDVRHIDWNVTARMQQPYVRQFLEDRDLTAWFLLDLSGSVDFGSADVTKLAVSAGFVAALARVMTRHGNRVGALLYGTRVDTLLPPRASRLHVLELLPGVGKKHMWEILNERKVEPFKSFADLRDRVKLMPDPVTTIEKRIISELEAILSALPAGSDPTVANRNAANWLLAKIYLNKGVFTAANPAGPYTFDPADMAKVVSHVDAITGRSMAADYWDNFQPDNTQRSSELIFVSETLGGGASGNGR